jgi:predicted CoA-binding protein
VGREKRWTSRRGDEVENLIREFINERVWAVVGASTDASKYGNKIFRTLRSAGYTVYGVNPRGGEIEGQELYRSLADLPEKPAVVDTVVPPHVTEQVVRQCAELGLDQVWMQPGSESQKAIELCHEHGIKVVYGACAMIRRRTWN